MSDLPEPSADVCIPNINREERRKRLAVGIAALVVALAALLVMLTINVSRWWRLALLPLFWGAASGYFQWRDKT